MNHKGKNEKTILEWALEYRQKGINVVKSYYKGKFPPKKGEWERYQTEFVPLEQIHEWFGNGQWHNLSAITGPISGRLTALDFDSEKAYRWWAERYPNLAAELPTSISGRGYHIFFRSKLNKDDTSSFQDMDIKGKGLVALPPSMHKSSRRYEWLIPLPERVDQLPLLNPFDWKLDHFTDGNDGIDGSEGKDGKEGVVKKGLEFSCLQPKTQKDIQDAIAKSQPQRYGKRYTLLFLFARLLKKIDELKEKSAEEIMFIADMWHEKAEPNIRTKSITMTRIRFKNAWEDAKYPPGEGKSLQIAVEEAFNSKMPMPELQEYKGDKTMEKLIRLCFALQKLAGDDDWFMPTNKAPELFGISHSWLAIMLNSIEGEIIKKTKVHTRQRCTRYRFIGPSIKLLQDSKN
ncbi:MAG: bifunctional DNA primase/polymerase [Planctomycetota bacterium]|jgi:hypothetical protein